MSHHRKTRSAALALAAAIAACGATVHADTVSWVADGDGQWTAPANWSSLSLPTTADDVIIDRNGGGLVTLDGGDQSIQSLICRQRLMLSGGATLSMAAASEIASTFTLEDGTLAGAGPLSITGVMNWSGGTLSGGTMILAPGAMLNVTGYTGAANRVIARDLVIAGTANWTDVGAIWVSGSPTISIAESGVLDCQNNAYIVAAGNTTGVINNAGIIRKSAALAESGFSVPVNNTGAIEVLSGKLSLFAGGSSSGTISVSPGALVNFGGGTFTVTNPAGLPAANLLLSDGALSITGDHSVTDWRWSGGTLGGTGKTIVAAGGSMSLSGNTGADRQLARPLENAGTINWTDNGSLMLTGAGSVHNLTGGLIDASGNAFISGLSGGVVNDGTIRKSSGSGMSGIAVPLTNNGSVQVQSGTFTLLGGGSSSGSFAVAPGATLQFGGGTFAISNASGLPTSGVALSGGTLAINGDAGFDGFTWTGGTLSGAGTFSIHTGGAMQISGTASKVLAKSLSNAGTITWDGGNLEVQNGSVVSNLAGGVFELRGGNGISGANGTPAEFNNAGTLRKGPGSETSPMFVKLNNTGTVEVTGGKLVFSGPIAQVSGDTLTGGTWILRGSAGLTLGPSVSIKSNKANITLDGPSVLFSNISALNANEGNFTVSGGAKFSTLGALNNNGTLSAGSGGSLSVNGSLDGTGSVSVSGKLDAVRMRQDTLSIGSGGAAQLTGGSAAGPSTLKRITIEGGATPAGKLDLGSQSLIVRAAPGEGDGALADIAAKIVSARDSGPGPWLGNGITSSAARDDASMLTGLAAILNRDSNGKPIYTSFEGQSVDADSVLVKYTLNGDADLNGVLDGSDYFFIDKGFLSRNSANPLSGYHNGDFNYDGTIDGSDYFLIDKAFLSQSHTVAAPTMSAVAIVPEPSGIATIFAAAGLLLRRRRRR